MDWNRLPDHRYELLARSSALVGRPGVVHVRIDLPPAEAAAFRAKLDEWTGGRVR